MSESSADGLREIGFTAKATRDMRTPDSVTRQRIVEALERLSDQSWRSDVRKLQGSEGEWRLRVGDHRIVYERDDRPRTISVLGVASRGRAYWR